MRCLMAWPSFCRGVWRVSGTQVESSSVKHVRSICVRSIRVRSISSAVYAGARARTHFEQDVSEFINIFFERIEETMQDKVCCVLSVVCCLLCKTRSVVCCLLCKTRSLVCCSVVQDKVSCVLNPKP